MSTRPRVITSACPSCGDVHPRTVYDVGAGPELSCSSCEWCWSAAAPPAWLQSPLEHEP